MTWTLGDKIGPLWESDCDEELTCSLCEQEWHGLAIPGGCPGEWADKAARMAYQQRTSDVRTALDEYVNRLKPDS